METQAKASDELTSAEEKMENLNKIKTKLEVSCESWDLDRCLTTELQVTLDELEDSHDREKKSRLEVDKQRRKVEADLKVCQEKVTDLEREKKDIEGNIQKKDADIVVSQRRLEDEQSIVAKAQKAIKELQSRVETSEEVKF